VFFTIKNYAEINKKIKISVQTNNNKVGEMAGEIKPGYADKFSINYTCSGSEQLIKTQLEVDGFDALKEDNTAFNIIAGFKEFKILIISGGKTYTESAVASIPGAQYSVITPSDLENVARYGRFEDFNIVIIADFEKRDADTISKYMINSKNKNYIIIDSENLRMLDAVQGIDLPVDVGVISTLKADIIDSYGMLSDLDLSGIVIYRHHKTRAVNGSEVLLRSGGDYSDMIVVKDAGSGNSIVYFGINPADEFSNARYNPNFPVIWFRIIEFLSGARSEDYNFKTGDVPSFEFEKATTPRGDEGHISLFDEIGFYRIQGEQGNYMVAVSLNDEIESDIAPSKIESDIDAGLDDDWITSSDAGGLSPDRKIFDLIWLMVFVALVFIIFEAFYMKRRKDM